MLPLAAGVSDPLQSNGLLKARTLVVPGPPAQLRDPQPS